ncbi:MAG: hypothetical protein WCE45_02260 [Sedimentisphaerales bacterium]
MATKEQIRPLYSELQGYLAQVKTFSEKITYFNDAQIWEQYNKVVEELNKISGLDYSRFRINLIANSHSTDRSTYQTKLGGLIARLHGEYFSDEPAPFAGMPTTIINQQQNQNQSLQVQMLLEIQSKIDEKIHETKDGSKEKTFLEKLKQTLPSIQSVTQLLIMLLKLAKEAGLDINDIKNIFS